jgi:hypothetical protein
MNGAAIDTKGAFVGANIRLLIGGQGALTYFTARTHFKHAHLPD